MKFPHSLVQRLSFISLAVFTVGCSHHASSPPPESPSYPYVSAQQHKSDAMNMVEKVKALASLGLVMEVDLPYRRFNYADQTGEMEAYLAKQNPYHWSAETQRVSHLVGASTQAKAEALQALAEYRQSLLAWAERYYHGATLGSSTGNSSYGVLPNQLRMSELKNRLALVDSTAASIRLHGYTYNSVMTGAPEPEQNIEPHSQVRSAPSMLK